MEMLYIIINADEGESMDGNKIHSCPLFVDYGVVAKKTPENKCLT